MNGKLNWGTPYKHIMLQNLNSELKFFAAYIFF